MLDVSALVNACGQLQTSLGYLESEAAHQDPELRKQFRSACIQAFEFTHELAAKTLRRHVSTLLADPGEAAALSHMELLRAAHAAGLPVEPGAWRAFRELRNLTTHTYDGHRAEEIVGHLPAFLLDAQRLAAAIQAIHG